MNPTRLLVLAFLSPTLAGLAQSVAPASNPKTAENSDAAVVLTPFEVRADQDTGYLAQNTASGSRLNAKLKDTPAAISVFTSEFLQDIAATNVADLTAYTLNTSIESGFVSDAPNGNNLLQNPRADLIVRGQPTSNTAGLSGRSVDFFNYPIEVDVYNTERVEFSRGPNSILFGLGLSGGGFNVGTKSANLARPRCETTLRVGSWDGFRAQLDLNQPLIKNKLGVRVALVDDFRHAWRPFEFRNNKRAFAAVRYQLAPKTTVDFKYEKGQMALENARPYVGTDWISSWLAAGRPLDPAAKAPFPSTNTSIFNNVSGSAYWVYTSNTGALANWQNMASSGPVSTNTGIEPMIQDFSLVPRATVVAGPGPGANNYFDNQSLFLRREVVRNLFVELTYNRQFYDFHVRDLGPSSVSQTKAILYDNNAQLPDGAANPFAGKPYVETVFVKRDTVERDEHYRATASYELDLGRWFGQHQFAGLGETRQQKLRFLESFESLLDNPPTPGTPESSANYLTRRTYVDLSGPVDKIGNADFRTAPLPGVGFVPGTNNTYNRLRLNSWMLGTQSHFLNDRLVGTLGYRVDNLYSLLSNAARGTPFAGYTLGPVVPGPAAAAKLKGITRSQGGVLKVTDWLSLYANRSSNFSPGNPAITNFPNNPLPPSRGIGKDMGAKVSVLSNRIFLVVDYYETTGQNNSAFAGRGRQNTINSIWTTLQSAGVLAADGKTLDSVTTNSNGFNFDSRSQGWEYELIANVTSNWRLLANYSENKTMTANRGNATYAYFNSQVPYWTSGTRGRLLINGNGALSAADTDPNTIGATVTTLRNDLINNLLAPNGTIDRGTPTKAANLRTNYTFTQEALKGFSAGAGMRWRDKTVIGYTSTDPATRRLIMGGSNTVWDGNVGYRRKLAWRGRPYDWSAQLNVNNLFDNAHLIFTHANPDGALRNYKFQTPREWIFSTTVGF